VKARTERCDKCRWWKPRIVGVMTAMNGSCHRHPPTGHVRPSTDPDDFCGEWVEKPYESEMIYMTDKFGAVRLSEATDEQRAEVARLYDLDRDFYVAINGGSVLIPKATPE
jgi:hypothetical protein